MVAEQLYMVRAGGRAKLINDFLSQGIVAVAWARMGDLTSVTSEAEVERLLIDKYADSPRWRPSKHYMEIADFVLVVAPGARVVTVDSPNRRFIVGTIDGPYEYRPESTMWANEEPYRNIRRVVWDSVVGFDDLKKQSRRETDLQNRSAVWLSPQTSADILSNLAPFTWPELGVGLRVRDDVQPTSKAPSDANELAKWIAENERRAFQLPSDYLARRAAAASRQARVVESTGRQYVRDPYVAALAKQLAGGVCDLCEGRAPFVGKTGEPYLEAHHVEWLSRNGDDAIGNVVALCPNCHRKMHALELKVDVSALAKRLRTRTV